MNYEAVARTSQTGALLIIQRLLQLIGPLPKWSTSRIKDRIGGRNLDAVNDNPPKETICNLDRQFNVTKGAVHRTSQEQPLRPFNFQRIQELLEEYHTPGVEI